MSNDYRGIILAAPGSGSGKTTITLGLLRLLLNAGQQPQAYKAGPDYIDSQYHSLASRSQCHNLDIWAMRPKFISQLISHLGKNRINVVEGVMGLFDGATTHSGSTADLAHYSGWPVILIIDASHQSHSIAALAEGFIHHREDIKINGLILNKVGSSRHKKMLLDALAPLNIPIVGAIPRNPDLQRPSRHLGLQQAHEDKQIETFIDKTAEHLKQHLDINLLSKLATTSPLPAQVDEDLKSIPPPGQHVAIARDAAFSFLYAHFVTSWQQQGCHLSYFSPMNDEKPHTDSDAIFLPGGYPELHLPALEDAQNFKRELVNAQKASKTIYAECGGHMVLGQSIIGEDENEYSMAGLLPHKVSFARPKLQLGYRRLTLACETVLGKTATRFSGHEFHYSKELTPVSESPLFKVTNAQGEKLIDSGSCLGHVYSSYSHLIDMAVPQSERIGHK